MPIYEFYCPDCHVIMNFYSRTVNTSTGPACPYCKKRHLEREVSLFATGGGATEDEGLEGLPIDESKMESAIAALASEAESMNEEDPRAAAQLMRKFSKMTGMDYNDGIENALQRMESGEDPEAIEADMGGALDDEDPFVVSGKKGPKGKGKKGKKRGAPRRDETLYDM